jgi:outer membrane lipoprotein carrier protein
MLNFYAHVLKKIGLVLFVCLPMLVLAANQDNLASTSASSQLNQLLQDLHSMRANFTESTPGKGADKADRASNGTMILQRPGKFRWEVAVPNKQLIVVNDKTVWIYDVDLQEVTKKHLNYDEPGSPAMLLSGTASTLEKTFRVQNIKADANQANALAFKLTPKSERAPYQWIKIYFVNGEITAMQILDNLGQQSDLKFSQIEKNISVAAKLFEFTAPPGVDVMDS